MDMNKKQLTTLSWILIAIYAIYIAWTIARVISGVPHARLPGHLTFTVPLLAAFMMVSWDLTIDPIFSTINHAWIWLDGAIL